MGLSRINLRLAGARISFSYLSLLGLFLCILATAGAANVPIRHANHLHKKTSIADTYPQEPAQHAHRQTYRAVGYYVNWAIYARKFPPQGIQASALTHIMYAFAGIDNKTGEAYLTDTYADVEKIWEGDNPLIHDGNLDLFGNLKQLYLLKKRNRNLKTLLSIGGWNARTYFAPALTNSTIGRRKFARTSVELLKDLGFDGLDIDWEYPSSPAEADALVETCRLFREELDEYSRNVTGQPHFLLTLPVPAGSDHFQYFDVPRLEPYVDWLSLMAYDYQGPGFSKFAGHQANVYKSLSNPRSTNSDTNTPVEYYLRNGLPGNRLNLGMPLYGRSFANTSGPGTTFTMPDDGSWEDGVWDYKALPLNGSNVYNDEDIVASWSYDSATRYMASYDEPHVAAQKAQYVNDQGLGGATWWEVSGDRLLNDSRSLIRTVTEHLSDCGMAVEFCENVLEYPESKYGNLRAGMPGE